MELNKIVHAEFRTGVVNSLASGVHEFLPVTGHHEFRVELRDQWKNSVHVLDTVDKSSETSPLRNNFVLRSSLVTLLRLHVLNKGS